MQRFSLPTKFQAKYPDMDACSQISTASKREQDIIQRMNTERLHGQYQFGANQVLLADLDQDKSLDLGNANPFCQTMTTAQTMET